MADPAGLLEDKSEVVHVEGLCPFCRRRANGSQKELNPEERLLRAIFGKENPDY